MTTINFINPKAASGEGRNGTFHAAGLNIYMTDESQVYVRNVTSRGELARGFVGIPREPEALRAIAQQFMNAADKVERDAAMDNAQLDKWLQDRMTKEGRDINDPEIDWGGIFGEYYSGRDRWTEAHAEQMFHLAIAYGDHVKESKA